MLFPPLLPSTASGSRATAPSCASHPSPFTVVTDRKRLAILSETVRSNQTLRAVAPPWCGPDSAPRTQAVFGTRVLLAVTTLITFAITGCLDNPCEQVDKTAVRYSAGHTSADRTFYQSSKPDAPFLRFPAGRVYHLEHALATPPASINVTLSFNSDGNPHAPSAGNQALLRITDDHIEVSNNVCADFYLRVTASALPDNPPPDASPPDASPPDASPVRPPDASAPL